MSHVYYLLQLELLKFAL